MMLFMNLIQDEDFRIGRGDKGSVFVTARKPAGSAREEVL